MLPVTGSIWDPVGIKIDNKHKLIRGQANFFTYAQKKWNMACRWRTPGWLFMRLRVGWWYGVAQSRQLLVRSVAK
jgi:hypothetical protein